MTARLLTILLLVLAMMPVASAAPFPGWQRQPQADALMLISPPDQQQRRVVCAIAVVEAVAGDVEAWFKKEVAETMATMDQTLASRSGIRRKEGLILEALRYKRPEDRMSTDLLMMAYGVGGNRHQLLAVVYESGLADSDPRVLYALDFVASAYRAKFALSDVKRFDATAPTVVKTTMVQTQNVAPPPAPTTAPPPQAAPSQQGKKCYRKPIWGLRVSPWCQPSGVCNDLWIKDYETVCE